MQDLRVLEDKDQPLDVIVNLPDEPATTLQQNFEAHGKSPDGIKLLGLHYEAFCAFIALYPNGDSNERSTASLCLGWLENINKHHKNTYDPEYVINL